MKKIVLSITTCLTLGGFANAQNVNIPDANFKNALLAHGSTITGTDISVIDTSGDGEIQVAEAQAYTGGISINYRNVSNLTGIEAFTNLTKLDCSNNSISSLDVSQNTDLIWLWVGGNSLNSLNILSNTQLEQLVCRHNNLTSLDVSSLTQLRVLDCAENQLTSLNVANGNNGWTGTNLYIMDARKNKFLNCVQHDSGFDPSTVSQWEISGPTFWSDTDCGGPSHSRLYVDASVSGGTGTGDSWANAFSSLYAALDSAGTNTNEIWVAKGTYTATTTPHTPRINNMKIYGGFAGTETNLSERDINLIHTTNASIISGDINGDDDNIVDFDNTTRDDNAERLMKIVSHNVTLDGLTISGAYADASSGPLRAGAGVFISDFTEHFTLKNCLIKENVANWGAGLQYQPLGTNSKLIIDACKFENNLTSAGASAFHTFPSSDTLSVVVINSLFVGNRTKDDVTKNRVAPGASTGWIRALNSGAVTNATIVNNTFVNNENKGSEMTSDFPTLALSINDGTFDSINIANNIFWGNKVNISSFSSIAIGRVRSAETLPSFNIYNSIDENNFSNINNTNLHNTSNTDPNLTSDFKLQSGSSAIDAGDNSKIPSVITTDIEGRVRIHNSTVDMGCHEFGAPLTNSINENKNSFSVYPNPTSGMITIESELEINSIEVFSMAGQKVHSSTEKIIDLSRIKRGVYFVTISSQNKTSTKKIIKQ